METYTWAGKTRVRLASLLEGGYSALHGEPNRKSSYNKSKDEEGELDITDDEDIAKYGQTQYGEADLIALEDENEGQDKLLRERVTENTNRSAYNINNSNNNNNNNNDNNNNSNSTTDANDYQEEAEDIKGKGLFLSLYNII